MTNSAAAIYVPLCATQPNTIHKQQKINDLESASPQSHRKATSQKLHSRCEIGGNRSRINHLKERVPQRTGAQRKNQPQKQQERSLRRILIQWHSSKTSLKPCHPDRSRFHEVPNERFLLAGVGGGGKDLLLLFPVINELDDTRLSGIPSKGTQALPAEFAAGRNDPHAPRCAQRQTGSGIP
jgi:hypothetical protein